METRKIFMKTAGGGGFPRLARVMTLLMLMLTGLGTGVKAADVDLSTLAADYTAQNGDVLKGTLAANVKITIADGATVTLKDAVINGTNNSSYSWAGLTLAGDGTIILKGENTVKGFYEYYPGIYVPSGKTVTIKGDGTLNASSNGFGAGIGGGLSINCGNISITGGTITATGGDSAAGIGGGYDSSCGNISITGGTITATGGNYAAGIGSGYRATVGNITITGGTVTATGGYAAAGIGSGYEGSCGNITITDGVTSVTATKGQYAPNSIGAGLDGSCGTVTIGGNVTGNVTDSPYTYTGTGGSAPAAEGFTAALAEGTEDAGKWTLKVGDDGTAQALPVEGLSEGQTLTLTYTGNRRVRSVKAIVVPAEAAVKVTAITLNKTATTITAGQTETLSVSSVTPDDATDQTVTWSSDNEAVATVDADGKVTAVALGTANITATANDGSGVTATCAVTVSKVVTINQSDWGNGYSGSFTKDGVTVSAGMIDSEEGNLEGGGTFSTTLGNFTKIEVTTAYCGASGTGWSGSYSSQTWAGTPASTVSFSGEFMGMGMTQTTIVCTIVPAN